jgi:glycosyltransferase involved in cell wall biosynthesis
MARISVLATPRDQNPYQDLLYEGVSALGVRVRYADGLTPSQTLNILLAPFLLVWYRIRGYRVLHIHWIFQFALPWAGDAAWTRYVMEWWFRLYLFGAAHLGFKMVWTAHDLLPFQQVFRDDARARARLMAKTRAIIALSNASAAELRDLGAKDVYVVPFGSYLIPYSMNMSRDEARANLGFAPDDVVVTLMGRVERYKGADLLLMAAQQLPSTSKIRVMIVGSCSEDGYRNELIDLALSIQDRAVLNLEWIPEDQLGRYLQASDFAAFPFRGITNSSSVMLAESFGLPVVIPNLSLLADVPGETAIRYVPESETGIGPLVAALESAEHLSRDVYDAMSSAASAWAHSCDWSVVARRTVDVYETVLGISH